MSAFGLSVVKKECFIVISDFLRFMFVASRSGRCNLTDRFDNEMLATMDINFLKQENNIFLGFQSLSSEIKIFSKSKNQNSLIRL